MLWYCLSNWQFILIKRVKFAWVWPRTVLVYRCFFTNSATLTWFGFINRLKHMTYEEVIPLAFNLRGFRTSVTNSMDEMRSYTYSSIWFVYINYIHIHIYNWPLQNSSQDDGQASYITQVVCINFVHELRNSQFKIDSEWQIFEKLFHGCFITPIVFAEEIFFVFIFHFDAWSGIRTHALRLISLYTAY